MENIASETQNPLNTPEGEIVERKKANSHNKLFASITKSSKETESEKKFAKELKSRAKAPNVNVKLFEEDLRMSELNKALKKLKPRKSPGTDGLHN